jgi:hypothetical protein
MMTDDSDDRINARVARAAERPVDVGRLQSRVRQKISAAQGRDDLFGWMRGPRRLVPAAFALLLVMTPFAVQRLTLDAGDDLIWSLASGQDQLSNLGIGG